MQQLTFLALSVYCLVTQSRVCEQLAQSHYVIVTSIIVRWPGDKLVTS